MELWAGVPSPWANVELPASPCGSLRHALDASGAHLGRILGPARRHRALGEHEGAFGAWSAKIGRDILPASATSCWRSTSRSS